MCIERVGSRPRTPSGVQRVRMLDDIDSTPCTPGGGRPATIRSSIHLALLTEGHPNCLEEFCKRLLKLKIEAFGIQVFSLMFGLNFHVSIFNFLSRVLCVFVLRDNLVGGGDVGRIT